MTISELDIIGTSGRAREPLVVDPQTAMTHSLGWTSPEGDYSGSRAEEAWIERIEFNGKTKRLFPGHQVWQSTSSKFLLVRRFIEMACYCGSTWVNHRFWLIDKERRMFYGVRFGERVNHEEGGVWIHSKKDGFLVDGYFPTH
ncbi:MAG: hypothetical protein GY854_28535, partial [Deltaproteobacteria bacterium]|nr:hypothetical protein [Deltaproteobacteria bacterium]